LGGQSNFVRLKGPIQKYEELTLYEYINKKVPKRKFLLKSTKPIESKRKEEEKL
jgi:hypothetical protein